MRVCKHIKSLEKVYKKKKKTTVSAVFCFYKFHAECIAPRWILNISTAFFFSLLFIMFTDLSAIQVSRIL